MRLSFDYTRLAAFDEENTPEQEEEFLSRDWAEAIRPGSGKSLLGWRVVSSDWHTSGGGYDSGPRWVAEMPTSENPEGPKVQYTIWSQRKFNEDWRGDYYTYSFDSYYKIIYPKKVKKTETPLESRVIAHGDTLAEVKSACEKHYRENFGE